jgi:hypothetical protein
LSERPISPALLYAEYAEPLRQAGFTYEFLFVTGPGWARLAGVARRLRDAGEPVVVLELAQAQGDAALVKLAAAHSRGMVLLTLPSYHRIEAASLPRLVTAVLGGHDLALARRWPRVDSAVNQFQNRALHVLLRGLARDRIHDIACGVIAMRPHVLRDLPLYGDFFRFLPVFALRQGYNVVEIDSPQHPGDRQPRVYSPGTYLRRLMDVFLVFFLLRFTEKPLRFFGLIGTAIGGSGGMILLVLLVQRLLGHPLAERPVMLLGLLLVVVGIQAIALGLIGEIVVHLQAPQRKPYRMRQEPIPSAPQAAAVPVAVEESVPSLMA